MSIMGVIVTVAGRATGGAAGDATGKGGELPAEATVIGFPSERSDRTRVT